MAVGYLNGGNALGFWSLYNPTRVIYGENSIESIDKSIHIERAVLVTSKGFKRRGVVDRLEELMNGKVERVLDVVTSNPKTDDLAALANINDLDEFDTIIALGGGSGIDTAKVLSRIIRQPRNQVQYDIFSKSASASSAKELKIVVIPTTAGTGSEVTPTATIWDSERGEKRSLCGDDLYPSAAFVDPVLTYDLPESITLASGLDAVSHALESVWNRNATPISVLYATHSLMGSIDALPRLKANPYDVEARRSMMLASTMAGLAISQTRTALCHSISYPVTLELDIPHGIACSFTLPEVLEFNGSVDDGRLNQLAIELGFDTVSHLKDELCGLLETSLRDSGYLKGLRNRVKSLDFRRRMIAKGRTDNNLRQVGLSDIEHILEKALDRYDAR